jgi:hypothetical protein
MENLDKIYLQSKQETIKGVEQRLRSLLSREIELITDVEEFYIPFEF